MTTQIDAHEVTRDASLFEDLAQPSEAQAEQARAQEASRRSQCAPRVQEPQPNADRNARLGSRIAAGAACDGQPVGAPALPAAVRDATAAAMAERDPQAEIELDLTCPACGHAFSLVFDTASFLLQELDARAAQVLREVHVLAAHYGWGEREILQMPARRRAR